VPIAFTEANTLSAGRLIMATDSPNPLLLLVEDSEDDAFFFGRTLQKSGITCSLHHVTDGAQAIEYLRDASRDPQHFPRAIFLDLKMPVVNGFEVLDWMRTQAFPAPLEVIVLSGSEHPYDKERATQLGATDYLVKPVKVDDFRRALQDICPVNLEKGAHV
jgi:CheY-like chemotaxis protein